MRKFILFPALLLILVASSSIFADSWAMPTERTVCSENDKYCLKITPKKLAGQLEYFQDKVDGKPNAGADKKAEENYCKGEFFAKDIRGRSKKLWTIQLVNEVSPVSALVSEDGSYVATFDNWHSAGYGDDAVVIYRGSDGSLVNKLALTDFLTESDYHELSRSVSSIWWSDNKHAIKEGKLVLSVVAQGNNRSGENPNVFYVDIDLSSGLMIGEKKNRYSALQFSFDQLEIPIEEIREKYECGAASIDDAERVSSGELLRRVANSINPAYPPAARAVRATGSMSAYILVSEKGDVLCTQMISGHALLKATVLKALEKWTFTKTGKKYWGTIAITGGYSVVEPEPQTPD